MADARRPTPAEWERRIAVAYSRLDGCRVCPRTCGVKRSDGELGVCGIGLKARLASANLHRGEEPPISGTRGSGTIFLAGCNLACAHCQNYPISQLRNGRELGADELGGEMIALQRRGAHNINLVTPSHCVPQVLDALYRAHQGGLDLPVVWNSSGYDDVEMLTLLDGVVDVYLPDLKYGDDAQAREVSRVEGYWAVATAAIEEMRRQVGGGLELDQHGVATRGLIVRHLVLPGGRAGTRRVLRWIADTLGHQTAVALMSQYFPAHRAASTPGLDRRISPAEFGEACAWLDELGLEQGWVQDESRQGGA